jgi:hypothetical protein
VHGKQAVALVAMDMKALAAMGVHPLVPFLANMHLDRAHKTEIEGRR